MASFFSTDSSQSSSDSPPPTDSIIEIEGPHVFDRRFFQRSLDKEDRFKRKEQNSKIQKEAGGIFKHSQSLKSKKKKIELKADRKSSSLKEPKVRKAEIVAGKSLSFRETYSNSYTQRELIDPFGSTKKIKVNKTLESLNYKEKNVEKFNKKVREKVKIYFKEYPILPLSDVLELLAINFFEIEITNETKNIEETVSQRELVSSESHRAKKVLTKLQKNACLIQEFSGRIMELQGFLLTTLQEMGKRSHWCNLFYYRLNGMASAYINREEEMNPLKTFIVSYQKLDNKMKDVTIKTFKLDHHEFSNVLDVFTKWGDLKTALSLREKVREIDLQRTLNLLNFSTKDLMKQVHEWFEADDSNEFLLKIGTKEILDSLPMTQFFVNGNKIIKPDFDFSEKKTDFLAILLNKIYEFYPTEINLRGCENQAYCLTHLETIMIDLKKDLSEVIIPWEAIQKKLISFKAIDFMKFKKTFKPEYLEFLNSFLLDFAVPIFNLLKMGSKNSWQKADESLRCLFTPLFCETSHNLTTIEENEILTDFEVTNKSFSVVQTRKYKILSTSLHTNLSSIIFTWAIAECEGGLKSCLQIADIWFSEEITENQKQFILKTLNNPNTIDYVEHALCGKPKIISGFII